MCWDVCDYVLSLRFNSVVLLVFGLLVFLVFGFSVCLLGWFVLVIVFCDLLVRFAGLVGFVWLDLLVC